MAARRACRRGGHQSGLNSTSRFRLRHSKVSLCVASSRTSLPGKRAVHQEWKAPPGFVVRVLAAFIAKLGFLQK
jgi:hypothetical protein